MGIWLHMVPGMTVLTVVSMQGITFSRFGNQFFTLINLVEWHVLDLDLDLDFVFWQVDSTF